MSLNIKKKKCLSSQEIESRLMTAGVNATAQRIAICRFVLCEADHPTAEEVKQWTDKNFPKLSLATVYNTLNILVEAKLLHICRFPHTDKVRYDSNMTNHYHFLDEKTGDVMDLPAELIEIKATLAKKYKINGFELLIKGEKK